MYIVLEKSFYLSVACVLPELSCGISICLLKHVVLFITFARNMISEVIHKPNIGNAPAAIYEYTATVMCWGSWQTMAAWYTLTAKGVTLYHAVMVYHGSMVIDVFPYCLIERLQHDLIIIGPLLIYLSVLCYPELNSKIISARTS